MKYKYGHSKTTEYDFQAHVTKEAVDGWEIVSVCPEPDSRLFLLITWRKNVAEQGQVEKLTQALRDAANANGTPVPSYYDCQHQIEHYQKRTENVAAIIADALKAKA
jgi:hypothetical protein